MKSISMACAEYLRKNKGAERIMQGFLEKYKSFGEVKGNILLQKPTEEERDLLRRLFKKDYSTQKSISISLKKFENIFKGTKYDGVNLFDVLSAYFNVEIITNKEEKDTADDCINEYFNGLLESLCRQELKEWLIEILDVKLSGTYKWIMSIYRDNCEELRELIKNLEKLLNLSEGPELSLPEAAAVITKNPHNLDRGTPLRKALIYFLGYKFGEENDETLIEMGNFKENSINRVVRTYGIEALYEQGERAGWEVFYRRGEPLILTDMNLNNMEKVIVLGGNNIVHCFENPSVYSAYMKVHPDKGVICTGGQLNRTAHRLFDLFKTSGINVYYHGDFDPEGLLIADKIINRYSNVRLFGYSKELYEKAMSNTKISQKRIKQLEQIKNEKLRYIGELIQNSGNAGYEEYIIDDLMKMENSMNS